MSYEITFLPSANHDLAEILETQLAFSTNKAKNLLNTLEKQLEALAEMPRMYPEYERQPEYRKMVVLDVIVFYVPDDKNKEIVIHRIIPGRMDIKRRLN